MEGCIKQPHHRPAHIKTRRVKQAGRNESKKKNNFPCRDKVRVKTHRTAPHHLLKWHHDDGVLAGILRIMRKIWLTNLLSLLAWICGCLVSAPIFLSNIVTITWLSYTKKWYMHSQIIFLSMYRRPILICSWGAGKRRWDTHTHDYQKHTRLASIGFSCTQQTRFVVPSLRRYLSWIGFFVC